MHTGIRVRHLPTARRRPTISPMTTLLPTSSSNTSISLIPSPTDDAVDPTPDLARALYTRMRRTLALVRQRFQTPLTLAEKLLLAHLHDPTAAAAATAITRGATYVQLTPDRVILQDVLGQTAFLQFMQTRRD